MSPTPAPTSFPSVLKALRASRAEVPPPERTALEWVYWENAAYLVDDARREECFAALRKLTGFVPERVFRAPRERLRAIAERGGMHPEQRVERWLEIAGIVAERHGGDLDEALGGPPAQAKKALRAFPSIGEPGADKILLLTGRSTVPALESNGLRVLQRLGLAPEEASYSTAYKKAQAAISACDRDTLVAAFVLLRRHGQEVCKRSRPECAACVLARSCPSARSFRAGGLGS